MTIRFYLDKVSDVTYQTPRGHDRLIYHPSIFDTLSFWPGPPSYFKAIPLYVSDNITPWVDEYLIWVNDTYGHHDAIVASTTTIYAPFENSSGVALGVNATISQVSAANRNAISNYLENRLIPVDTLTGTHTIRQMLETVAKRMLIRRYLKADDFIVRGTGLTLDSFISDIPINARQNSSQLLQSVGFDMSAITLSTTIRAALNNLASQDNSTFFGSLQI